MDNFPLSWQTCNIPEFFRVSLKILCVVIEDPSPKATPHAYSGPRSRNTQTLPDPIAGLGTIMHIIHKINTTHCNRDIKHCKHLKVNKKYNIVLVLILSHSQAHNFFLSSFCDHNIYMLSSSSSSSFATPSATSSSSPAPAPSCNEKIYVYRKFLDYKLRSKTLLEGEKVGIFFCVSI